MASRQKRYSPSRPFAPKAGIDPVTQRSLPSASSELVFIGLDPNGGTNATITPPAAMTLIPTAGYQAITSAGEFLGMYYDPRAQTYSQFMLTRTSNNPWGTIALQVG